MAERSIPIQTALMPAYYKDFHCIMGACQDNCCDDGWKIEFNKKDYLTIKRAPKSEEMEELMRLGMCRLREKEHDGLYAEFHVTEEGRCAFHTPEGLCRLQLECGEAVLPQVCQVFPRKTVYTAAGKELSLSLACEGVLALLWDLPNGIDFWEEPLPKKEWVEVIPHSPAATRFADIRALCVDVLQARPLPLPRRLLLLGLLIQDLRDADWSQEGAIDRWLDHGSALLQDPASVSELLDNLPRNREMFLSNNLWTLYYHFPVDKKVIARELLNAVGKSVQTDDGKPNIEISSNRYQELEGRLEELLCHSDYFFENIMVAVLFYRTFPRLTTPEELWKDYVELCELYSLYRFSAVCAMDQEASRERLFHVLVYISRDLGHSKIRQEILQNQLFQNDSATLAHMAILVGG